MSACPSSPITVLAACIDSAAVPTDAAADPAGEDLHGGFLRASFPPFWTTYDPEVVRAALKRLDAAQTP